MSYLGNVTTAFAKWATDQINAIKATAASLPVTKEFVSSQQSITSAGLITLNHGLGVKPKIVYAELVCVIAELGYSVGDTVAAQIGNDTYGTSTGIGMAVVTDIAQVNVRFGNAATPFSILNKATGSMSPPTIANWRIVFRAYA